MYSSLVLGAAVLIFLWLGILTYIYIKGRGDLKVLFPEGEDGDIRDKFREVLATVEGLRKENQTLNKNLRMVYREGLGHVQKSALRRYNPYDDTGGNVSFSLGLLDGKSDGVVITSLHARSGTRVYVKEIKNGQAEMALTKEEKEVVEKAMGEKG